MWIYEILWKEEYVDKLEWKHDIRTMEVEQILFSSPLIRRVERGRVRGEDLYTAYGQTNGGRYLIVFFVLKAGDVAMPISARNMTPTERRLYERHQ